MNKEQNFFKEKIFPRIIKREEEIEDEEEEESIKIIIPNKNLTIKEISKILKIDEKKIINVVKKLKIKNNEIIKPENTILISEYLNILAKINYDEPKIEKNEKIIKIKEKNIKRNIIISIIGEVDTGKTTLINQICENKFEEKKNITQEININSIKIKKTKFIFLDTPGHKDLEDFKNFSIKISDIIILIINCNENLNSKINNTIEKLEKEKKILIININKIDLEEKNYIENELKNLKYKNNYNFNIIKISAKKKIGIKELLKTVYILKKKINNKININDEFEGIVVENNLNKKLKIVTTIYVKSGNIKNKDVVISGENYCIIKKILNHKYKEIKESKENNLIKIMGFKNIPNINEKLTILPNEKIAKRISKFRKYKNKVSNYKNKNLNKKEILNKCKRPDSTPNLNLIIKSNSNRILEILKNAILNIKIKSFKIKFIKLLTENLNISDIKLAKDTKSQIIIFNSEISENVKNIANKYNINIMYYNIIYEVIDYIKSINSEKIIFETDDILGIAKINKIFNIFNKIIIGCLVIKGKAKIKSQIKIFRKEKEIYRGNIESLKLIKNDVIEVKKGLECGIFIKNFKNYLINDKIVFYKI